MLEKLELPGSRMQDFPQLARWRSMGKAAGRPPKYNEKPLPDGLRGEFCATMRRLANKHGVEEITNRLAELKVSKAFVYHVLRGLSIPEVNDWPAWALALKLKSWRSFFKS